MSAVTFDTFQSTDGTGLASTILTIPIVPAAGVGNLYALAVLHTDSSLSTANTFVSWGDTTQNSDNFTELAGNVGSPNVHVFGYVGPSTVGSTVIFEFDNAGVAKEAAGAVLIFGHVHQTTPTDTTLNSTGLGDTTGIIDTDDLTLPSSLDLMVSMATFGATDCTFSNTDATETFVYNTARTALIATAFDYEAAPSTASPLTMTFTDPSTTSVQGWVRISLALNQEPITVTVNQVTETDTPQAVTGLKGKVLTQVSETDAAQSVAWAPKNRLLSQASETDLAQIVVRNPINKLVTQAVETDLAQSISKTIIVPVGQVMETDISQAFTWKVVRFLNQASETETAGAVSKSKSLAVGQITETDIAQAVTSLKNRSVAGVLETDLAQSISVGSSGGGDTGGSSGDEWCSERYGGLYGMRHGGPKRR